MTVVITGTGGAGASPVGGTGIIRRVTAIIMRRRHVSITCRRHRRHVDGVIARRTGIITTTIITMIATIAVVRRGSNELDAH
ncbi:hypothetical protein GCM10023078_05370 [Gibbsiella greigii]